MRLFILNVFSRNSLAAIKALNPSYELIGGACSIDAKRPLLRLFRTRKVKDIFFYSDPSQDSNGFCEDLIKAIMLYKPKGIIASGTITTDALSYYKEEIKKKTGTKVLVDDFNNIGRLTDKFDIYHICKETKVPIPKTYLLEDIHELPYIIDRKNISYPLIIKPRHSYASIGVEQFKNRGEVVKFSNSKKCLEFKNMGEFVIQQIIYGDLHDVTLCAYKGEILSILSQQRLLTLYDFGGGGIINRTTDEPKIKSYAERIVKKMNFSGIALFDFTKDKHDNYYLLECNPKIWGTTQLTIEAGMNVVKQLVDSQIHCMTAPRKTTYEVGLVYKWLFPDCIAHWFKKPLSLKNICVRIYKTFKHYEGTRTLHNLTFDNFVHLMGTVINKTN